MRCHETEMKSLLTGDAGDAFVACYRLPRIVRLLLKRLDKLHCGLELAVSHDKRRASGINADLGVIGTVDDPLRPILDVRGWIAGLDERPIVVELLTRVEPIAGIDGEGRGIHNGLASRSGEPRGALLGDVGLGIAHIPRDPLPPLLACQRWGPHRGACARRQSRLGC